MPPFFVTGYPKTGTTFLQRLLNLHPQISCPSEQDFRALQQIAHHGLKEYAEILKDVDRRTGGQGAPDIPPAVADGLMKAMIAILSKAFAGAKPIHGLNDNNVFLVMPLFLRLFPDSRFVAIVRNPVDVGLSLWRHLKRLAREEPDGQQRFGNLLENPKGSVEGYIEMILPRFRLAVDNVIEIARDEPRLMIVRYENLVADKRLEIERILTFLGANFTEAIVSEMIVNSSKEAMASTSRNPAFFGLSEDDPDKATVSPAFRERILKIGISPQMQELGYDVAALMAAASAR